VAPAVPADRESVRELVGRESVYQGPVFEVLTDTFRLHEGGDPVVRDYLAHPGAVAVVVLNDSGQLLLLSQYRHPVEMVLWEIPAGLLDVDGEDFAAAAARELAEEADLVAAEWHVLVDVLNSPGYSNEAIRIFLARGISAVPAGERHQRTDEEAEIQLRWVELEDAVAGVLAGSLHNPSAVAGILAAAAARARGFASLRPADAPFPIHPSQRGQ
jgi:ADP-ribose pyrophosphatase